MYLYQLEAWGKDGDIDVPLTIEGDRLSEFLGLCFRAADLFSLSEADWARSVRQDLRTELEPFLVGKLQTIKWFGYDYSMAPPGFEKQIGVRLYRADPAAKDVILKYCDDIFLKKERNGVLDNSTQNLEDLCFFSKGKLFVGTVSHASILSVAPPDKAWKDAMKKFGDWRYYKQPSFNDVTIPDEIK